MDDGEGGLSFDFEGGLDSCPTITTSSVPVLKSDAAGAAGGTANNASAAVHVDRAVAVNPGGRRSFRQTVCRHWLRSLCMKGDACGFLHQYDKLRMPICRFFRLYGECREQDCVYKHSNEDIKECNMYKLGFCPNGPDCRYRHAKLPGPPPPVEEVLQKIQQITSYNHGNRFFQNRNTNYAQQTEKPQFPHAPNAANQGTTAGNPGTAAKFSTADSPIMQPQEQIHQSQQQVGQTQTQIQNIPNGQQNQGNRTATPLPQGISRYFIVKSNNPENLELSVQQGVWATQRSNEAKLNEAFDSVENVILIFSVNRTRHFQGCAKMTSKIAGSVGGGNWKYAHGTAHYGRNFSVKWLKLSELSFHITRHLRNPYNENLPVKISRDCQELEPSIGEQLASLLYLEPDSELMAVSLTAESKRDEEKAKGLNRDNGTENPDIVPFEDNEEEEEEDDDDEEESEEDESYNQAFRVAAQGRGRGQGMMWPPHLPFARGPRPPPGMRGFPPTMMGGGGFSYAGLMPDGFPLPDLFGVGPHPFTPYGPRIPGDLGVSATGMMFHGRPEASGFGMMVGPGRAPFMGGMSIGATVPARGGRPVGMPPMFPPLPNRSIKRDPRGAANDKNERYSGGSEQGKGQEMGGSGACEGVKTRQDSEFGAGNNLMNEESGSEDEAPRRSRHGEGKKKRVSEEIK